MRYSQIAISALVACAYGHGVVTSIQGANGVSMPGLSVADGTPRDCATPACGSEADTSIIRDNEISSGKCGPLGRTNGAGSVSAEAMVANFMGTGAAPQTQKATKGKSGARALNDLLGGLTGGGGANGGTQTSPAAESGVAASAGKGKAAGLPTCADDGTISMTFRQINQDGAGGLEAAVDGTSGGTDAKAFQTAQVTKDVPGIGVGGLSLATKTDFPVQVKMPAGMTCEGKVAGVNNVCVVRVRNNALAGPFGGSAVFTQSAAARKRAIAYRMKKRQEFNNLQ